MPGVGWSSDPRPCRSEDVRGLSIRERSMMWWLRKVAQSCRREVPESSRLNMLSAKIASAVRYRNFMTTLNAKSPVLSTNVSSHVHN